MYWILFIGIALISYLVQANLKNKFEKYSKMPLMNGMTGRDVAIKMLHDNGIYDVKVISTPGMLTDHYNPANNTVNLSNNCESDFINNTFIQGECREIIRISTFLLAKSVDVQTAFLRNILRCDGQVGGINASIKLDSAQIPICYRVISFFVTVEMFCFLCYIYLVLC